MSSLPTAVGPSPVGQDPGDRPAPSAAGSGRLDITPMTTGSVAGAFELFDAVSKGVLDCVRGLGLYSKKARS